MLMADDRTKAWSYENSGEDDVGLCIDLGSLWDILEESPPDSMQNSAEDLLAGKVKQGLLELGRASSVGAELSEPVSFYPSYNSEASDYRVGASDGSVECVGNPVTFDHGKQELSAQTGSPASCSGSLSDWMFPASGYGAGANSFIHNFSPHGRDYHDEICQEISNCGLKFCFAPGGTNNSSHFREALDSNHSNRETEFQFNRSEVDIHSQYGTLDVLMEKSEIENAKHLPEIVSMPWDIDDGFNLPFMSKNDVYETDFKDEWEDHSSAQAARVHGVKVSETPVGGVVETIMGAPTVDDSNVNRLNVKCEDHILTSPTERSSFVKLDNVPKAASQFLTHTDANLYSKKQAVPIKTERNGDLVLNSSYDGTRRKSLGVNGFLAGKSSRKLLRPILPPNSSKNFLVYAKDEKEDISLVSKRAGHSLDSVNESASGNSNPVNGVRYSDVKALEQPYAQPFTSMTKLSCEKDEIVEEMTQTHRMDAHFSKFGSQPSNALVNRYHVDDESDVCILEDLSEPSRSNPCSMSRNSLVTSQSSMLSDPLNHMGMGGLRLKANDERLIYRVVLQDLSQPKTEASPPDGVLAVPLLRHQRIALSWMVQKETGSLYCSGGILADDQGLGKTISTIALILKERAPTSSGCLENYNQNERETFNLDEDDECAREQDVESCQNLPNGSQMRSQGSSAQAKGRLPAGTLVVCPTSVLRQWAEELHNKVTSKGNLSVLVYHGSNRTKDPCELAKYDVVLTTYSIVSMEVPKQPLVDVDDDETGRDESHVASSIRLLSCKKRKYPPTSGRSSKKDKKGIDSSLLESAARPLAGVRWFRVVLDEAQSIKNHRTQVARACWGLRAKRRWCLSGTPIQNAVDDLYSYFRFLRYDPYATYKSFCSSLKVPISRNPTNGYKKLQAVLKTVMLRRTKGTLLDGEPIINLPPKVVELKKVDFTKEERDFYCRLEADSRAQFAEYAAAGTVKQNYVNILLMLLRLRQACDHPLLVRGYDSSSAWRSSIEMAKILPREKLVGLLNCLEASLAICGVCNDPPEDAVVTSCGHVFCNQCICEHLTGDDNLCPTTNCKSRLSVLSVFSRATLKCSLTQEPGQNGTPVCSGSEVSDKIEYRSWSHSFDSSKIKAALKVLQSLSKPEHSTSQTSLSKSSDVVASWPKKSLDPFAIAEESDMGIDDNEDTDLVEGSNELIKVAGEKAIVFSQWTRMLDLLENCLKTSSIQYRRLDGTMSVVARDKAVKDFNSLPEVSVMIMSLKAASLGLNMVAACHVLLLDLWWNPTTEDQAVDRAHRIGQTRPVSVLRLTVKDTVEDRILALQQKKREMVASAFGEDETGCQQTRLTVEDLKYLFMA